MKDALQILLLAAITGGVIFNAVQTHQDLGALQKQVRNVEKAVRAGGGGGGGQPAAAPQAPTTGLDPTPYLHETDAGWGPEDAPVLVVEYSDFQCPFCRRFADNTAKEIRKKYDGKIRYVFKHLPLKSIHPHAMGAAVASQCANEQGKFWEYYDILFANQRNLEAGALERYAGEIGLDVNAFNACIARPDVADKVNNDLQAAIKLGITGTPGFIIAGTKVSGARPFSDFESAIDAALADAE